MEATVKSAARCGPPAAHCSGLSTPQDHLKKGFCSRIEVLSALEVAACLGDRGGERKPREQWCSTPCNANLPCIF